MLNKTQKLIKELEEKASKTAFANISFATQKVLVRFMAIRGDAWSRLIPERLWALDEWNDSHWKTIIQEISKTQGSKLFKVFDVPTVLITDYIFDVCDDISCDHKSWKEYHDWYLSFYPQPVLDATGTLPACIYTSDSDVLEDGWNLLHFYVASDHEVIPLVSFC